MKPGDENRPRPGRSRRREVPQQDLFIQRLAARLKVAYTLERQFFETQRDGTTSRYSPSSRYDGGRLSEVRARPGDDVYCAEDSELDNVWEKVALRLHTMEIDPVEYVHRVFFMLTGKQVVAPSPPQLTSGRMMELYAAAREGMRDEVASMLASERSIARTHVVTKQTLYGRRMRTAIMEVLYDDELDLSPLFKYCLARSLKDDEMTEIANKYFLVPATVQYIRARAEYDETWGEWIPVDFSRQAQVTYEALA